MFDVTAVRYGSLSAPKSQLYHRFESYGEADSIVEMDYYFWLLRDGEQTVVVDTGFDPAVAARRGRTCLIDPIEALRMLGVDAAAVPTVVLTHFHYDHVGNIGAFESAQFIAPADELAFWTSPIARRSQFAAHVEEAELEELKRLAAGDRLRTSAGTEEILPGLTVVSVGGHSPGQQLVVVESAAGEVVLASDAIHFYEELDLDRPFGVISDLGEMYAAYDRLSSLGRRQGTVVIPGHDPEVAARFPTDREGALQSTRLIPDKEVR